MGCSREPSRGLCVRGERYRGAPSIHWRNPGQVPLQLGLAELTGKGHNNSAFSSSWLGLGRLLPGKEPGGEGPSLKLLGRS